MDTRIALFGGSFNPPGIHHQTIARRLARYFDRVIVIPNGSRPDKTIITAIRPCDRKMMVRSTFEGVPGVEVDYFDLEQREFTRAYHIQKRYEHLGDLWHVAGTDLIRGGKTGSSEIQTRWYRGREIWNTLQFAVIIRPEFPSPPEDLPPHARVFDFGVSGSSTAIRDAVFRGDPHTHMVVADVSAHIRKQGLYADATSVNI